MTRIESLTFAKKKIPVLFVYITSHARINVGSVEIELNDDVFLKQDMLKNALQKVNAHNVIFLSDFCRSEAFNFDLDHPKCLLWMTACGREQLSFNFRYDNGFFTKCLLYGMYCKNNCPGDKSVCENCANFRMQCAKSGLLEWNPLFEYVKNHVIEMVQKSNQDQPCTSEPTFWCSNEKELLSLRVTPPKIEVWIDNCKKHEWLCSIDALSRHGATLLQLIGEKSALK